MKQVNEVVDINSNFFGIDCPKIGRNLLIILGSFLVCYSLLCISIYFYWNSGPEFNHFVLIHGLV